MVNLTIDPAVDVTQACVRRRFRFSSCRACADVCPAQAFSLAQGQVSIDTTRCIACGDCLFVCPVDAIIGIKPVKRFVQGDTLVGPFSLQAPTVDELLIWHSQYGIRFIDIAVERSAQWLMALAGLNLALRRYGEPGWSFKHVVGAEINASRRTLFHVPRDAITPCAVEPGKRRLRQAFSAFSECVPEISPQECRMCGACWRSCPENVIQFDDNTLTIVAARCTGCSGCAAVCPHQALRLRFDVEPASTRHSAAYTLTCESCKRTFHALTPEHTHCVLCQSPEFAVRL
ncbi:4Fe-4S binding protein [Salmonella enterica]|uniref:4Fe-4S binding protein n=1 Tax=Salmonella enterica TaxID=28901 RepID=UPI000BA00D6E|nr:4Fe-4S binding protein [Salmonella enterica]EBF8131887.1 4Fe-4S dicluster domain-containing protein [Salmonella enterica subsp. enterica]OZT97945.1 ferredoxin [Salmonella enterica subsp. enterica serovar Glostrup]